MTPPDDSERRSKALGIGVLTAVLMAFSALMTLVSVALYRVEREEIDGNSEAVQPPASNDER